MRERNWKKSHPGFEMCKRVANCMHKHVCVRVSLLFLMNRNEREKVSDLLALIKSSNTCKYTSTPISINVLDVIYIY